MRPKCSIGETIRNHAGSLRNCPVSMSRQLWLNIWLALTSNVKLSHDCFVHRSRRDIFDSGLPVNWTNPSIGSVTKTAVRRSCPWMFSRQEVRACPMTKPKFSCLETQAKKHRAMSLFTGVGCLELGASRSGPRHQEKLLWRSGFLWPRFCQMRLAVNSLDGLTSRTIPH